VGDWVGVSEGFAAESISLFEILNEEKAPDR
jgi:hypothetical protein